MPEDQPAHKRRVRYKGKHPRKFSEKYKEHNPERYAEDVQKVLERGHTPAGTHRPICVNEVLRVLDPKPGETGLDCTLGFGGHARELLARLRPGGRLFATDVDPLEFPRTEARLRKEGYSTEEFLPRRINFAGIAQLAPEAGSFDFILADLGLSSMQIDNPSRGFTFKDEGPLDLRLNPQRGKPASDFLLSITEEELADILRENADEPRAAEIARAIKSQPKPIAKTTGLANVIKQTLCRLPEDKREHETKKAQQRVFQAIRIAVNDEFTVLEQFLRLLPWCMRAGGRVAILTFHSGEDNRVKQAFEVGLAEKLYETIATDPIRPTPEERLANPRSSCARLRWAVRAIQ